MNTGTRKTMYLCPKCGPFVRVYKELWTEESEGPHKIEFVQHVDGFAKTIDEVIINKKPEGEILEYAYCGKCNRLIDREQNMKWLEEHSPF